MKKLLFASLALLLFVPFIKINAEEGPSFILTPSIDMELVEIGDTVKIKWEHENIRSLLINLKRVDGLSSDNMIYVNTNLLDTDKSFDWLVDEDNKYYIGHDVYLEFKAYGSVGNEGLVTLKSGVFKLVKVEKTSPNFKYNFESVVNRVLNSGEKNVHFGNIIFESYYDPGYTNLNTLILDNFDITFTTYGSQLLSGDIKLIDIDTGKELCKVNPYYSFAGIGINPDISINSGRCEANLTILGRETKKFKVVGNIGTPKLFYTSGKPWAKIILSADKIYFSGLKPNNMTPWDGTYSNNPMYVLVTKDEVVENPISTENPKVEVDKPVEKPVVEKPVIILEPAKKPSTAVTKVDSILTNRLRGKILLQVESHGEAWYVRPDNGKRIYMKDGSIAYGMMRNLGLGITNADLKKIPIGIEKRFSCADSDEDGLCDKLEAGLGTDPNKKDSDGDGHEDGTEVQNNYDPLSAQKLLYNNSLINRLKGQILLQVESRGEAWYINPGDGKRYYMPDGPAAYEIMRFLSLGITDKNLSGIVTE